MLIGYCDYDSTMAKWSQQPICSHNIDTFTITNCHFVPLNANPNRHSTLLDEIYLQIRQAELFLCLVRNSNFAHPVRQTDAEIRPFAISMQI